MDRIRASTACAGVLLLACTARESGPDTATAMDTGAPAAPAAAAAPGTISLADVAGTWNMRSVPETGRDTSPTTYTIIATADTTGWTLTFPGREPMPLRVRTGGDSLVFDVGPYESVRRPDVQVTVHSVARLQDGRMVGTSVAGYSTTGPDSIVRFRTEGTKAP